MIEASHPDARAGRLSLAARSRLVWSGLLLAAGLTLGLYLSAEASPEAAAALHDLRADANLLRPYALGNFERGAEIRKSNVVVVGYVQRGIDDARTAREHFASDFARLGYRPAGTDLGRTFVRDRFCRGSYEARATNDTAEPAVTAISFSWGDGVRCP